MRRGPPTSRDAGLIRALNGLGLDLKIDHAPSQATSAPPPKQPPVAVTRGLDCLDHLLRPERRSVPTSGLSMAHARLEHQQNQLLDQSCDPAAQLNDNAGAFAPLGQQHNTCRSSTYALSVRSVASERLDATFALAPRTSAPSTSAECMARCHRACARASDSTSVCHARAAPPVAPQAASLDESISQRGAAVAASTATQAAVTGSVCADARSVHAPASPFSSEGSTRVRQCRARQHHTHTHVSSREPPLPRPAQIQLPRHADRRSGWSPPNDHSPESSGASLQQPNAMHVSTAAQQPLSHLSASSMPLQHHHPSCAASPNDCSPPSTVPSPHLHAITERTDHSLLSQLVSPCDRISCDVTCADGIGGVDRDHPSSLSAHPRAPRTPHERRRSRWAPNPIDTPIAEADEEAGTPKADRGRCGMSPTGEPSLVENSGLVAAPPCKMLFESESAMTRNMGASHRRPPAQTPPHVSALYRALLERRPSQNDASPARGGKAGFHDWAAHASAPLSEAAVAHHRASTQSIPSSEELTAREARVAAREQMVHARESQLEVDFEYVLSQLDLRLQQKKADIQESKLAMQELQRSLDVKERALVSREAAVRSLLSVGAASSLGGPNVADGFIAKEELPALPAIPLVDGRDSCGNSSRGATDACRSSCAVAGTSHEAASSCACRGSVAPIISDGIVMDEMLGLLDQISSHLIKVSTQLGPNGELNFAGVGGHISSPTQKAAPRQGESRELSKEGGDPEGAHATVDLKVVTEATFAERLQTLAGYLRLVHRGWATSRNGSRAESHAASQLPSPHRCKGSSSKSKTDDGNDHRLGSSELLVGRAEAADKGVERKWSCMDNAGQPGPLDSVAIPACRQAFSAQTASPAPAMSLAPTPIANLVPPPIVLAPQPPPLPAPPPPPPAVSQVMLAPPPLVSSAPPPPAPPTMPLRTARIAPPPISAHAPPPPPPSHPASSAMSNTSAAPPEPLPCAVKMRAVHWAKLPPTLLVSSVWLAVDTSKVEVDAAETEAMFAVPQPPPRLQRCSSTISSEGARSTDSVGHGSAVQMTSLRAPNMALTTPPALHVLSLPRANNVAIFLKKISKLLTCEQLCNAVMRMEAPILEPELLDSVLANLPGEAEAKALRSLRIDDPAKLTQPERFCFEMARLPRLGSMLHALRLRHNLPSSLQRASSALASVAEAAQQLMGSPAFVHILASVLAHGNYLNSGTSRAGARGIKLEGLEKARAIKSVDGKTSLLQHACRAARLSQSSITSELGSVRAARRLPLLEILRIIQEVEEGVGDVRKELALCPLPDFEAEVAAEATDGRSTSDSGSTASFTGVSEEQLVAVRFRQAMAPFYAHMQEGLDDLTRKRDETKTLLKGLASWLGEDPTSADADAILAVCADLVDTAEACSHPGKQHEDTANQLHRVHYSEVTNVDAVQDEPYGNQHDTEYF